MTCCPPGCGGEDFGGSVTQAKDGRVYLQAGKTAVWNVELSNLDKVRVIGSGSVTLTPKDQSLARAEFEKQSQQAVGTLACEVVRLTPRLTGNLSVDFKGFRPLEYRRARKRPSARRWPGTISISTWASTWRTIPPGSTAPRSRPRCT